jgi:hypothetical protein
MLVAGGSQPSSADAPASAIAAVQTAAVRARLPIVSLRSTPSLRIVVRLDRPVAQLRRGSLLVVLHAISPVGLRSWDLVAVDRNGVKIRESRIFGAHGEAYIRPDLDGCDPSYAVLGQPVTPMFGSDAICAGAPAAPVAHPVDVGGARVGETFPLALAVRGQRLYAMVNRHLYTSPPGLYLTAPVGTATLRSERELVAVIGGVVVTLERA